MLLERQLITGILLQLHATCDSLFKNLNFSFDIAIRMHLCQILVNFQCLIVLILSDIESWRFRNKQEHAYHYYQAERKACNHKISEIFRYSEHNDCEAAHQAIKRLGNYCIEISIVISCEFYTQYICLQEICIKEPKKKHVNIDKNKIEGSQVPNIEGAR